MKVCHVAAAVVCEAEEIGSPNHQRESGTGYPEAGHSAVSGIGLGSRPNRCIQLQRHNSQSLDLTLHCNGGRIWELHSLNCRLGMNAEDTRSSIVPTAVRHVSKPQTPPPCHFERLLSYLPAPLRILSSSRQPSLRYGTPSKLLAPSSVTSSLDPFLTLTSIRKKFNQTVHAGSRFSCVFGIRKFSLSV
jgi:hypothetical protein